MTHAPSSQLWIVGTPLSESTTLSDDTIAVLARCDVIIGESAKVARRWCARHKELSHQHWFFLDGIRSQDEKELFQHLARCKKSGLHVALFSDGGMPILFDPGETVLSKARELQFEIRTAAGPTSWGTALAVSGYKPPFLIEGFPPRKTEERESYLATLAKRKEAILLMDTPYRFELLLSQVEKTFPPGRQVFIAWEIGTSQETYLWSSVAKVVDAAQKQKMRKGEFVLILASH
jgi:16S rRNA (cytidine1402-2'-O)-methyltransferase